MKVILPLIALTLASSNAADITFTNKVITFTNLEGKVYSLVELIRADRDGLIWQVEAGGGRVCYTNLAPAFLETLGIPTNRIGIARARASRRALLDAQERAAAIVHAQAQIEAQAKAQALKADEASADALAHQMRADSEAIATLETQIAEARIRLRRAQAQARDYNSANRHNDYAPHLYVKEAERVKIEEAAARLKQMKREFALKYKR